MIAVICHPSDEPALWLHHVLPSVGLRDAQLVSCEALAYSRSIVHRVDDSGDTGRIELGDGRVLQPESISGLINRITVVPTGHFATASPPDRDYATEELTAFLLAWLDAIRGRVIDKPLPSTFGGGAFHHARVLHLAAAAGLPIGPHT